MFKNIRKYGWWGATLTMYVVVLVAYVSSLPGWVWFLGGLVFMALWVKAEAVADENAAKRFIAEKKYQKARDSIALGEYSYSTDIHLLPWDDYHSRDEVLLRESVLRETEEVLDEEQSHLESA